MRRILTTDYDARRPFEKEEPMTSTQPPPPPPPPPASGYERQYYPMPSMPAQAPGSRVELAISSIDLLELTLHCEFKRALDA